MNLSRRAFLTGATATAATATLPAIAAPMETHVHHVAKLYVAFPYTHPAFLISTPDGTHKWFLHSTEWEYFKARGFDMSHFNLIQQIPTLHAAARDFMSGGPRRSAEFKGERHERQAIRLSMPRNHQKRQYGPRPPIEAHIRSFRREA